MLAIASLLGNVTKNNVNGLLKIAHPPLTDKGDLYLCTAEQMGSYWLLWQHNKSYSPKTTIAFIVPRTTRAKGLTHLVYS